MFVEQELVESEARLCASAEEQREAREELATCRSDIQILQGTLATERERADKLQQAEVRAVSLISSAITRVNTEGLLHDIYC